MSKTSSGTPLDAPKVPGSKPATGDPRAPEPSLDERLDEALDESFPASDPPAVHSGRERASDGFNA